MAVAVFTFVDQSLLEDPHPRLARVVGGAAAAAARLVAVVGEDEEDGVVGEVAHQRLHLVLRVARRLHVRQRVGRRALAVADRVDVGQVHHEERVPEVVDTASE